MQLHFILIILTVICVEKGIGVFVPPDWEDDSIELTEPIHKIKPTTATSKDDDTEHTTKLEKESESTSSNEKNRGTTTEEKTPDKPPSSEISNRKANRSSNNKVSEKPTNNETKRQSHTYKKNNAKSKKKLPKQENPSCSEGPNKITPVTDEEKSKIYDKQTVKPLNKNPQDKYEFSLKKKTEKNTNDTPKKSIDKREVKHAQNKGETTAIQPKKDGKYEKHLKNKSSTSKPHNESKKHIVHEQVKDPIQNSKTKESNTPSTEKEKRTRTSTSKEKQKIPQTSAKKEKSQSLSSSIEAKSAETNSNELSSNKNYQTSVDDQKSTTKPKSSKSYWNEKDSNKSSSKQLSSKNSENSPETSKTVPKVPTKNKTNPPNSEKSSKSESMTSSKPTPIKPSPTSKTVPKNEKPDEPVANGPFPVSYNEAVGLLYGLNKVPKVALLKIVSILEMCGNSLDNVISIIKKKTRPQNSQSDFQAHDAVSIMNAFNSLPYKELPFTIRQLEKLAITRSLFQNIIANLKRRLKVILKKVNENLKNIINRVRS